MTQPNVERRGNALVWAIISLLLLGLAGLTVVQVLTVSGERETEGSDADAPSVQELRETKFAEAPAPRGEDWPAWRGPNRDGVSGEKNLRTSWPERGLAPLWSQPLGDGFSSVIVAQGKLIAFFQDGKEETLWCLDAESGKPLWRFGYEAEFKDGFGNGPRSTPCVDGEHLYAVGATGLMHCLRLSGGKPEVVWKRNLIADFGARVPSWGMAFSPLVEGDLVFIQPGGGGGKSIAALDRATGETRWSLRDDPASYSSPIAATFSGERQVLFFTGTHLVGVTPDGKPCWEVDWVTDHHCNVATPIIADDYVFVSTNYGVGCGVFKVEKQDGTWRAERVYKNKKMKNHFNTSVKHQDFVYGFDDSNLVCMNFRDGAVQWKERGFNKGSLLLADGHLVILGENGLLAVAEATPAEYREKGRFQATEQMHQCWAAPVLWQGRLYVRDKNKLTCYDMRAEMK